MYKDIITGKFFDLEFITINGVPSIRCKTLVDSTKVSSYKPGFLFQDFCDLINCDIPEVCFPLSHKLKFNSKFFYIMRKRGTNNFSVIQDDKTRLPLDEWTLSAIINLRNDDPNKLIISGEDVLFTKNTDYNFIFLSSFLQFKAESTLSENLKLLSSSNIRKFISFDPEMDYFCLNILDLDLNASYTKTTLTLFFLGYLNITEKLMTKRSVSINHIVNEVACYKEEVFYWYLLFPTTPEKFLMEVIGLKL